MRRARRITLVVLVLAVSSALAPAAAARQFVEYGGSHSQVGKVRVFVLKKDSGARYLRLFLIRSMTITCEDGRSADLTAASGRARLADDGSFETVQRDDDALGSQVQIVNAGEIRFRRASGTFEFRYATLDDEGEAQLCTTGAVTWSAERRVEDAARVPRHDRFVIG